jgi:hypothetical protein
VQVDPIKPKLELPRSQRLKVNCDIPPSTSAFKFNLRHYNEAHRHTMLRSREWQGLTLVHVRAQLEHICDTFMGQSWVTWGTKTAEVELKVDECAPLASGGTRCSASTARL